ncbi:ribonuclease HII [Candidatus Saccharibacteria bacterium]|nr:ribonuclease HII [Candidatus Saccharibacteria bacterium]
MSRLTPTWDLVTAYADAGRPIIGIDEVGRGAWAGPVVAGAVILRPGLIIDGLNDSKLVPAKRRLELDVQIRAQAVAYGLGWVWPAEVDEFGLSWAVAESGRRAITGITKSGFSLAAPPIIILDGKWNYLAPTHDAVAIVKADSLVPPVAAGSIIAKVARDTYMAEAEKTHPGYGFAAHVGYGTVAHRQALASHGPTPIHRLSYKPLSQYV